MRTTPVGSSGPECDPTTVVVRLRDGSLASDLTHLRSEVAHAVLLGHGGVSVDLSGLDHLSSPTVAAILWARRTCSARRVPFTVTGGAGLNARVLRSCGLAHQGSRSRW